MQHKDILKLLFPVEIEGVFDDDLAIEGKHLDSAQVDAEKLLSDIFPDTASSSIADWERLYEIVPDPDSTLQARRSEVVRKFKERLGLSRQFYINLAQLYGWTITIDEFWPFMCGWNQTGEMLYAENAKWCWRVNVSRTPIYRFRVGESFAGERLTWWPANTALEALITDLKPAHTAVVFNYEDLREVSWEDGVQWEDGVKWSPLPG